MASHRCLSSVLFSLVLLGVASTAVSSYSELSPDFYEHSCPQALEAIERVVRAAVYKERRMGASLLRLHFHDCFVNGCDASILLDDSETIESEKKANANANSARGFEVIDDIKREVDRVCGGPVVSCADILAVAARDSVVALGGPSWEVRLGRRDSKTASRSAADEDIPAPFFSLSQLIDNFKKQGLDEKDLVVLSGGHTIGYAQCRVFRDRIYNDPANAIDPSFAQYLRRGCPSNGGDSNLAPLDPTAARFDVAYFSNLLRNKGLLHSDQQLFTGNGNGSTDEYVKKYGYDTKAFHNDFATSMIKMGDIKPLTGYQGEIRRTCSKVNSYY